MYNRKTYLYSVIASMLLILGSNLYISKKANELSEYWGSDYLAEIYQHSYSLDKFFIQLSNISFYFFIGSLILLIFNFKSMKTVNAIIIFTILITFLSLFSLNYAPTDDCLSAIGSFDLGKTK